MGISEQTGHELDGKSREELLKILTEELRDVWKLFVLDSTLRRMVGMRKRIDDERALKKNLLNIRVADKLVKYFRIEKSMRIGESFEKYNLFRITAEKEPPPYKFRRIWNREKKIIEKIITEKIQGVSKESIVRTIIEMRQHILLVKANAIKFEDIFEFVISAPVKELLGTGELGKTSLEIVLASF